MHGAPSDTPPDVRALLLALRLGKSCMECQQELPRLAEQEQVLVLEIDIDFEFLEPSERHQEVHAVASETADRLGVDDVDLPRLAIGHEALEARAGADGAAGLDVGVGADIFPTRMLEDLLFLEIHLGREAVKLALHLRAHSAVQGYTLALG